MKTRRGPFSSRFTIFLLTLSLHYLLQKPRTFLSIESRQIRNGFIGDLHLDLVEMGNSLHGTSECAREWKMMVIENSNKNGDINLPPLVLRNGNVENMVVCIFAEREENHFKFSAKLHPSTPKTVKSREMLFKIILHIRKQDNAMITKHAQNTVSLGHAFTDEKIIFEDFHWNFLSHWDPPLVNISILPANKKTDRKRHS